MIIIDTNEKVYRANLYESPAFKHCILANSPHIVINVTRK